MSPLVLVPPAPDAPADAPHRREIPEGVNRCRPGRRPVAEERRREVFCIRLNGAERELIARAAQEAGEDPVTVWARDVLVAASRR